MRRLDTRDVDFDRALRDLTGWTDSVDEALVRAVDDIVDDVMRRGDEALLDYTRRFDRRGVSSGDALEIPRSRLDTALAAIKAEDRAAFSAAILQ